MILYFDNYITDMPFHRGAYENLFNLRNRGSSIYKMPSKLDITLYTLASYAKIKWSNVIIKYELENISQKNKFEKEVRKLFPRAIIIYGRSDSQKKFQESLHLIDSLKPNDEWIFYAGNNDHPYIAYDATILNHCLTQAQKMKKKYKWVSVVISHYPEFLNKTIEGTPFHEVGAKGTYVLEENGSCITSIFPTGLMHSMQIVHLDLFKHWFFSGNAGEEVIRRSECIEPYVKTLNQVVIIPKKEICAHFDGEIVSEYCLHNVSYNVSPPLFIPPGFFKKKVKIRFGYEKNLTGWVNINPCAKNYSFDDPTLGTDLKIGLGNIPIFWRDRIETTKINPQIDMEQINNSIAERYASLKRPFIQRSKIYYATYRAKLYIYRFFYNLSFTRKISTYLFNKFPKLKKIYKNSYKS